MGFQEVSRLVCAGLVLLVVASVSGATTIDLPHQGWCYYSIVYLSDRRQLFLSGGYTCNSLGDYTRERLTRAALVDLETETSYVVADKPTAVGGHAQVYYDGKVYAIAGATNHVDTGTNKFEIYDLATDSWTSGPDAPWSYGSQKCVIHDSTVVCAGGYIQNRFKDAAYSIDLSASTLQWTTLPSLSDSRTHHGMATANGYVYVISGYCAHYCYSTTVETLDVSNPTSWRTTNLPDARFEPSATSANGELFVISGLDNPNRVRMHSYLRADATDPLTSWSTVQFDMGAEGDYTADADQKYAYYSETSGVMVAFPKTSNSLLIMTVVAACNPSQTPSEDGSDGSFYCVNGGSVSGIAGACTCTGCDAGYSGASCEVPPTACTASGNPSEDGSDGSFYCVNGGSVSGIAGACTCTGCDAGYSGASCQTPSNCTLSSLSSSDGGGGTSSCINGSSTPSPVPHNPEPPPPPLLPPPPSVDRPLVVSDDENHASVSPGILLSLIMICVGDLLRGTEIFTMM